MKTTSRLSIRYLYWWALAMPLAALPLADLDKNGSLTVGGREFQTWVFDQNYRGTLLTPRSGRLEPQEKTGRAISWTGSATVGGTTLSITKSLRLGDDGSLDYQEEISPVGDLGAKEISLGTVLPVDEYAGRSFRLDGQAQDFPGEKFSKPAIVRKDFFQSLQLPFPDFRMGIQGNGGIVLQDGRHFGTKAYEARLVFTRDGEKATLGLKWRKEEYPGRTLPLHAIANRTLRDLGGEGWTGQGPANDLRSFPLGTRTLSGLPFQVGNPEQPAKPAAVILGGTAKTPAFPKTATLAVQGLSGRHLGLLHGVAWAPMGRTAIGTVVVHYADETTQTHELIQGMHVGDWFSTARLPLAEIAWSGTNGTSEVGLYATFLELKESPISRIEFKSAGNCIWMVLAATLADEIPARKPPDPVVFKESADWKPILFPRRVEKGGAMDFSFLLDAPAGKHGKVIAAGGHFTFEKCPDKSIRFFGGNLMPGWMKDRALAASYAERLAECGYNAARLHMYDIMLVAGRSNSLDIAADRLDRLDELVEELTLRGIYHTLDLYCWRVMKASEVPEWGRPIDNMQDYKALMFLLEPVRKNFADFSRKLLSHVNPRTGARWADHPGLISINLVNEGKMTRMGASPAVKALYQKRFASWLETRGRSMEDGRGEKDLFSLFLEERYRLTMEDVRRDLSTLGHRIPLSDQNDGFDFLHAFLVGPYDYVDNHYYFDWPSMSGPDDAFPHLIHNRSEVALWAPPLSACFPTRILGKPFTISEFSTGYPNLTRASSGVLAASYGALQDWDALYRFLPDSLREGAMRTWETALDPVSMLADRLAALLFLRGDVKPSSLEIPIVFPSNHFSTGRSNGDYPWPIRHLGFVGRVGTHITPDGKLPGGRAGITLGHAGRPPSDRSVPAIPGEYAEGSRIDLSHFGDVGQGLVDEAARRSVSSTGELHFDAGKSIFKAVTPKTEVLIAQDPGTWTGRLLSVSNQGGFGLFAISSLDGAPLETSRRLLVFHVTQVVNTGLRFTGPGLTSVESHGVLPLLLRKGQALFSVRLGLPQSPPKIFSLDLAGKRVGEIPCASESAGTWSFKAETLGAAQPCMIYEVVR